MQNFLNSLSTDNYISIIGMLISLLTSIVAIGISLKTLKQNSRMITESTRPYVVMYSQTTNFQNPAFHLILKNFGQSGATITNIECDTDLSLFSYDETRIPFSNFQGVFIAPGQSFSTNLDTRKIYKDENIIPNPISFKVSYKDGLNIFSDNFIIHFDANCNLINTRASTNNKELKIISYTLQDLVEKNL